MTRSPTEWPTYQVDAANTGAHPTTTGPGGPVEPRWQVEAELPWYAAPIVVDDTVYAGNNENVFYALDAETGAERWRFVAPETVDNAATVVDDYVFVGNRGSSKLVYDGEVIGGRTGASETLHKLDADTGAVLASMQFKTGISSSPVFHDGSLFVCAIGDEVFAAGAVCRVDVDSLAVEWKLELEYGIEATPAIVGDTIYVGTTRNEVIALDVDTGEERWRTGFEFDPVVGKHGESYQNEVCISSVVATDSTVLATSEDRSLYALDRSTGAKRWEIALSGRFTGGPAIVRGAAIVPPAYSVDSMQAIDLETGAVRWNASSPPSKSTSPTVAEDRVYVGSKSDGTIAAIDGETGEQHWTSTIEIDPEVNMSCVNTPITVLNERLYASIGNSLYALETP